MITGIYVILLILGVLVIILAVVTPKLKNKYCKKCPKIYCALCSHYPSNRSIFYIFSWLKEKLEEEQQHNDSEEFHCEFRDCDVTYRKTCKNCIVASVDKDGNFYCPYYEI